MAGVFQFGRRKLRSFWRGIRDWCGDCTSFPREVAEAALAHQIGNETERAYRRGDALEKRRANGKMGKFLPFEKVKKVLGGQLIDI